MDISIVSPGTERARYLKLPNAAMGLARPGYSGAGTVLEVGPGADEFAVGQKVAVSGAPHMSVATVGAESVYAIPPGVAPGEAAMVHLGIICGQGVSKAELSPGRPICVLGAGPIGALTQRLASAAGAGPATVIARSRAKEAVARAGGAREFLALDEDPDAVADLAFAAVIEATGDPDAVSVAVAAAAPGATVVLLGSPRGVTSDLPVAEIRRKRLRLVGAHIDTLKAEARRSGQDRERQAGELFMLALADGRLSVSDMVGEALDPNEAGIFYRELAKGRHPGAAYFDWSLVENEERVGRGHLLKPPDISGRGLDHERRPLSLTRRSAAGLAAPDPFAGAAGDLRIGLLGCGDIATNNAAAVASAPNAHLVACFDPVERLARGLGETYGARACRSSDELLSSPDVDAVFISVPHHLHAPLAKEALDAGRHVIVEKPLANTLADAVSIAEAAERAGRELTVCFPYRYDRNVVMARTLIEAGALGRLGGTHVRLLLDKPPSYWVGGFSGRSPSDWRSSRARAGGGVLIMNMSHYVDLVRHIVGMEVDELTASAATADEPSEVEDSMAVNFTLANGAFGTMLSASAVRGTISSELRFWGRDGHIRVEPTPRVYSLRAVNGLRAGRWHEFGGGPMAEQHVRSAFVSRFGTALAHGRPPEVSASDALAVQAFTEAAYRSAADGVRVRPADLLAAARS
jgi:predicted dehydrogenase/threonine dehydrogenase-like Zn-dependent dehydrogenase